LRLWESFPAVSIFSLLFFWTAPLLRVVPRLMTDARKRYSKSNKMQLRDMAPSSAVLASLLAIPQLASAFYLPGVAPTSYKKGDLVPLYVNSIKPVAAPSDSRLHAIDSYDYYHPGFKFCEPTPPLNMCRKAWAAFCSVIAS